jgi:hypothetical protein
MSNESSCHGAGAVGQRRGFPKNGGINARDVNSACRTRLDRSEIDPSILGTLFQRELDPNKRGPFGAHYADALREGASSIFKRGTKSVYQHCGEQHCTAIWLSLNFVITPASLTVAMIGSARAKR